MNFRRLSALPWLLPALVILLAGCATHRPVVSAWRDSQSTPTRADTIGLIAQPDASPANAELSRLLTAELKREGFKLVPVEQADYLMAYTLEDELVDQGRTVAMTTPTSPPQTTRQVLGFSATGDSLTDPTLPARTISQPVVFRNRGIRLFLYNNPKTHPGGFQIVWQGYITAGQTASAERETALIRALLGYWGQEYHGSVNLAP